MRNLIGLRGQYGLTQGDIDLYEEIHDLECSGCRIGKSKAEQAKSPDRPPTTRIGEIVHMDVAYITTPESHHLYLVSRDDFSGYGITLPIKSRKAPEIADALRNIISIYASYGHKILSFRSDNEASFTSSVVRNTLTEQGVTAGKEWYRLLCSKLESWGYTRSVYEPCLFTKGTTIIAIYVDDILVLDSDVRRIDDLQEFLRKEFRDITVKTGPKITFLGMTIDKQKCGDYVISQKAYAEEISKEYALRDIKAPKSPANSNLKNSNPKCERFDSATYRSEVMKFLNLATRTRPDILYATAVLASRANDPSIDDFHKLTRLAQYVFETAKDSIRFSKKGKFVISGYADASFASHTDAKGHTGYAIFIDGTSAAIACKSIKQRSVAHSSMEAELIALHDMLRHILWIRDVVDELGLRDDKSKPVSIQQDNMPAISAVTSDLGSMLGRSKYIDRRLFTVHEYIENGQVKIEYCATEDMVADLLTKSLTGSKANRFNVALMGNANDH